MYKDIHVRVDDLGTTYYVAQAALQLPGPREPLPPAPPSSLSSWDHGGTPLCSEENAGCDETHGS